MNHSKRLAVLALVLALVTAQAASASAVAVQGERTLQPGDVLSLEMQTGLSSETSRAGDKFKAKVFRSFVVEGQTIVPAGSIVDGHVSSVQPARRLSRSGTIAVEFDRITLPDATTAQIVGQLTSLDPAEREKMKTDEEAGEVRGDSSTKRNVIFIGGGAGVGAIIGAVAGNTGAGAGVGAGAGTAAVLLSKGNPAEVPVGAAFGLEILKPARLEAEREETDSFETRDDLLYVQAYLKDRGLFVGVPDGKMSSSTRAAVVKLQRAEQIEETGSVDIATARVTGLADSYGDRTQAVKALSAETSKGFDGTVDVRIQAQTNTGGWSVFESWYTTRDTLHVYVRGVPPRKQATQALAKHDISFQVEPARMRGVLNFVVHHGGPDLKGRIGEAVGAGILDAVSLDQAVSAMRLNYERALGARPGRTGVPVLSGKGYTDNELELMMSLHAFANAVKLYASLSTTLRSDPAFKGASQMLIRQARLLDRAVDRTRTQRAGGVAQDWDRIRPDIVSLAESLQLPFDKDSQ